MRFLERELLGACIEFDEQVALSNFAVECQRARYHTA